MPQRRRVHKGSFATHFDDLVRHFTAEEQPPAPPSRKAPREKRRPSNHSKFNQRLFERAVR